MLMKSACLLFVQFLEERITRVGRLQMTCDAAQPAADFNGGTLRAGYPLLGNPRL